MNFIDKLIIPESFATLNLLTALLLIGRIMFFAYSGVLLVGTLLSVLNINRLRNGKSHNLLSAEFINLPMYNNLTPIGLGIVPFLGILLILFQILHQSNSIFQNLILTSFLLYLKGIFLLFGYRFMINKNTGYGNKDGAKFNNGSRIGILPVIIGWMVSLYLFCSLILFIGSMNGMDDVSSWETKKSISEIFLSIGSLTNILKYLFFSFSLTSILMIFKLKLKNSDDETAFSYNHKIANFAWIALLVFCLISLFTMNPNSITISLVFTAASMSAFLLAQIYLVKENAKKFVSQKSIYIFVNAIIILSLISLVDHSSFAMASGGQVYNLASNYEKDAATHNKATSEETKDVGKEIYTTKCMSCHAFEQKVVGSPHKLVMQKYADNKEAMIQFILKPVKVDPDFPDMPQQGLTPSEVKAVVEYMYKEYGEMLK